MKNTNRVLKTGFFLKCRIHIKIIINAQNDFFSRFREHFIFEIFFVFFKSGQCQVCAILKIKFCRHSLNYLGYAAIFYARGEFCACSKNFILYNLYSRPTSVPTYAYLPSESVQIKIFLHPHFWNIRNFFVPYIFSD